MSTQQLQEAQDSQSELLGKVSEQTAETRALCTRIEDLESQLKQETEAREYLAIELNKAEGRKHYELVIQQCMCIITCNLFQQNIIFAWMEI